MPLINLQGIASGQASAGYLSVSGRTDGTLTLFPNQTLQVDNGCQVTSNLIVGSGATLKMASFNYFTNYDIFHVTGNLTNQAGSTNIMWVNGNAANPTNVAVNVTGTLVYGGTLVIYTNGVGYMQPGASFQLFPGAASYSGSFSSITPSTPGPGLVWDTSKLTVNGTLFVGMIPTNKVTPSPVTVTYGNNVVLTSSAGGTAPLTYQWYSNSVPISGQTGSILTLTVPSVAASGNYSVAVANTYGSVTNTVAVTINKATPTATLAVNNSPVTYNGSAQAATVAVSVSSVPGSAQGILTGGAASQTGAGTYAVTANFVPTDTTDYNTLTGLSAGNFVINQATPVINTPPTASAITYGQTLGSATLSGGSATPSGGSFAFTTSSTVPPVGTAAYSVTYTPLDTTDYTTATTTVSVTVNPACTAPSIVGGIEATATNLCFGSPLVLTLTNAMGTRM